MDTAWQGVAASEQFAVGHSGRDEAAFLLACHFLREGFEAEKVHSIIEKWDRLRNEPPLQDDPDEPEGVLRIKINSAAQRLFEDGHLETHVSI